MNKLKTDRYFLLLPAFILFTAFAFWARYTRFCWNNIPLMVIPDVLLSASSAFMGVCLVNEKKLLKKLFAAVAGFLLPNVFIWGLSMGLQSVMKDHGAATCIGFIALFFVYLVLSFLVFFKLKDTDRKRAAKVTAFITAAVCAGGVAVSAAPLSIDDSVEKYDRAVRATAIFENTIESAIAQTEIADMVNHHFRSELSNGKTEKKCIIIGFDGTRADVVSQYTTHKKSGIRTLLSDGGHACLSYCGGVTWPAENTQATSTAPGWCSMVTGEWADKHGIYENHIPKSLEYKSLFLTLLENEQVDSTKFCVSYDGHFNNEDSTYYPEKQYAEQKGLNVSFMDEAGDKGTYQNVMNDIRTADCSDFLFCIFEECDHTGHQTNFTPENFGYADAFRNDDAFAYDIVQAIKNRDTYSAEDWLIVITSDHGGYISSHGGASKQERYTFIITNQQV